MVTNKKRKLSHFFTLGCYIKTRKEVYWIIANIHSALATFRMPHWIFTEDPWSDRLSVYPLGQTQQCSACLAGMKSQVQTSVLPKRKIYPFYLREWWSSERLPNVDQLFSGRWDQCRQTKLQDFHLLFLHANKSVMVICWGYIYQTKMVQIQVNFSCQLAPYRLALRLNEYNLKSVWYSLYFYQKMCDLDKFITFKNIFIFYAWVNIFLLQVCKEPLKFSESHINPNWVHGCLNRLKNNLHAKAESRIIYKPDKGRHCTFVF
jgi:hypothetical protein